MLEKIPTSPMDNKPEDVESEIEHSLNYLNSFCSIMYSLGESHAIEGTSPDSIAFFSKEAFQHIDYLRDHCIDYRKQIQTEVQNGKEE
ncbi:MAG: hypothetical protein QY316_06330 [Thermodesulfobacteriota bacterium]|nr:MAG: hypothetical protein QY316_06330 [Thermodesulfobacteriota bacterium]